MAKIYDTIVNEGDVCTFCGAPAKTRSKHTGNYSCELTSTKCPALRARNAVGVKKAHTDGRMSTKHLDNVRAWSRGLTRKTDPRIRQVSTLTNDEIFCRNSKCARRQARKRILDEELIPYVCSLCGQLPSWNGKELTLQLEHKNGINDDHRLENLTFLCPNCHTQTETWGGKRKSSNNYCKNVSDEDLIRAYNEEGTACAAFRKLGLSEYGMYNYDRLKKLLSRDVAQLA